jgi:hypothetical protein
MGFEMMGIKIKCYLFSFFLTVAILLISLTGITCHSPTEPNNNLSLTLEDVSSTEAWLNLNAGSVSLPVNITLKKNDNDFISFTLSQSDTTIYDSTLSPNQTYIYQVVYGSNKTEEVTARTLDTTSNNFTWQTYTFGVGGDNSLKDVAIINDTSIWAVGKFAIQDSGWYNAAHWDGRKWNFVRLEAKNSSGNITDPEFSGILVFSSNDIWFAGGSIYHWDGKQLDFSLERYTYFNGGNETITKLWGTSDSNIYGIGTLGTLVHFNGQSWQQIESGTTLDIQDIWGIKDPTTGEDQILCIASNIFTSDGNMLLRIEGNKAIKVSNKGLPPYYFSSIWFKNSNLAYLTGNDTYKSYNFLNNTGWSKIKPRISTYYSNLIRGNNWNDIVFCGSNGDIAHFNGVRWQDYLGNILPNFYGQLYGIAIKANIVCAVGTIINSNAQAIIIMGKR